MLKSDLALSAQTMRQNYSVTSHKQVAIRQVLYSTLMYLFDYKSRRDFKVDVRSDANVFIRT